MATIPTYQRRVAPGAEMQTARAQSYVSRNDPIAESMQRLGAQGMSLASTIMTQERRELEQQNREAERLRKEEERKAEDRAAVDVANVLSQADVTWQERVSDATKSWKVGDPDLRESLGKEFDTWANESAGKLPTEKSRQYFQQHVASMKSRIQTGVFKYQEGATDAKIKAESEVAKKADVDTVFRDPSRFDDVLSRKIETIRPRSDLSEAGKITEASNFSNELAMAAELGLMDGDLKGWYRDRFGEFKKPGAAPAGGVGGFDDAVARVFKHEGGYAASDGNTGAPVNFGINQKANPDIDVKNLTKEGAAQIYKQRYWGAIGGDSLPAALQATALDAAVNQGPSNANKWIAESGGDPVKFNELRRAHYEKLLEKPENAKFRKAWLGRLDSYAAGAPAPAAETAPDIIEPKTFSLLYYQQKQELRKIAETRISQSMALDSSAFKRTVEDAAAMARDGIAPPDIPQSEFMKHYGADGERMHRENVRNRELATGIASLSQQPVGDIERSLNEAVAKRNATPAGEGYREADARVAALQQAAQQVVKAREEDGAGYAVKNSTQVASAFDRMAQNPQDPVAAQAYAMAVTAEQDRLGIRKQGILPAGAVIGTVQNLLGGNQGQTQDGFARIQAEREKWGAAWPAVHAQLSATKMLPDAWDVVASGTVRNPRAAQLMLNNAALPTAKLKDNMASPADVKVVQDGIRSALVPLRQSLAHEIGGEVQFAKVSDQVERMAYLLSASGSVSVNDAVNQAYQAVIGDSYHFMDRGAGKIAAIPRFDGNRPIDIDRVEQSSRFLLGRGIDSLGVRPLNDMPGVTADVKARHTREAIQDNGFWTTAAAGGKETGLQLMLFNRNGTVTPIIGTDGKPVIRTWAQLQGDVAVEQTRVESTGNDARGRARALTQQRRNDAKAFDQNVDAMRQQYGYQ